jgi:hypothetical protein
MEDKLKEAIMKMGAPGDMPAMAINLGNEAFNDLMKDKLKVALDRTTGPMMERQAAIVVAFLNEYWMSAMAGKELPRAKTDEYVKRLQASYQM